MTKTEIITSQYVRIDQTPAGIGERIFARLLDFLIMFVYCIGMYNIIKIDIFRDLLRNDYGILFIFILFIPVIFYSLLWEIMNRGRSPGKMAFGMRVVMRDGTTPTLGAYTMRWMFILIDVWMGWIGVVIILLNKNNQRFGDLSAGTIVIKERDYHRMQVSLDEFNHLSRGYIPVFPKAENLSLEQINTISEALTRFDENRSRRLTALSVKVGDFLKVTPLTDNETFLRTLIRDYQYYALEEI